MGEFSIHPDDQPWESMIETYHPNAPKDFQKLTKAVHGHGTAIFAQLNHHGFQSSGAITRKAIWGPSALSDVVFGETAKPMELEDFEVLIDAFAESAMRIKEGGFDGIEIDIGPESLLRQFLSPLSNLRQDEYGGGLENRMKLPLHVLKAIKERVGEDFTVGIRLCVDEHFWGAITLDDSQLFAESFVSKGKSDFINVSMGTYYNLHLFMASMHMPMGFTIEAAEHIKQSVSVPVIASHQIGTPQMADAILEKKQADAVGLIRNLICDPDFALKALEGKPDHIRYCVRDNKGCIGRVNRSRKIGCIQNPEVGNEALEPQSPAIRASRKKRVMVIGGGSAGLEAARAAREKGHDVIVYEKESRPGGQINLIAKRPRRKGMRAIIRYLEYVLKELQVPIITNTEITVERVAEEDPDAIVVATGSIPIAKPVPGTYGPPKVLNVWDVLKNDFPIGERILFMDENGGHHAASTVEFLADQGKKIHMVTSDLFIGMDLAPIGDLFMTRQRLLQKGVVFETDLIIDEVREDRVMVRDLYTNTSRHLQGYDTIILDMGNRADDALYGRLKGRVKALYRVGDCIAPRGIDMAIIEGRRVGESI
jgi:mycofactocin system FadH/OYE family oxidoreductase 2